MRSLYCRGAAGATPLPDEHAATVAGEGVEREGFRHDAAGEFLAQISDDATAGPAAGADDEIGERVAVQFFHGHADAATTRQIAGEEIRQDAGTAALPREQVGPAEGEDPRRAAGAAAADQVGLAVAVHVAD